MFDLQEYIFGETFGNLWLTFGTRNTSCTTTHDAIERKKTKKKKTSGKLEII